MLRKWIEARLVLQENVRAYRGYIYIYYVVILAGVIIDEENINTYIATVMIKLHTYVLVN